jgi:hypothetical protein
MFYVLKLCECGCGLPTTLFRHKYRRFITGHYSKTQQHKQLTSKRKDALSPVWKGDNVGYEALHAWVRVRKIKPDLCERCNIRPARDLANISHQYKRDLLDWEYLCRSCHMIYDGSSKGRKAWNKGNAVQKVYRRSEEIRHKISMTRKATWDKRKRASA